MSDRWLYAWGLVSIAFGGASLIVPLYVVELGGSAAVLGILFATASFAGVPGALVVGRLADRTGRRRTFVLGAIGTAAVALVAVPAVGTIPVVVLANAALWFAFSAATPVLTLLAVVDVPESAWSDRIARLNEVQGVGWALGLLVGFVVIAVGTRLVGPIAAQRAFLLACAASAGAGLALGRRTLPADPPPGEAPSPRRLRRRIREAARFNVRGAAFPVTPVRIDVRRLHPRRLAERFTRPLALYFVAVVHAFAGFGAFFAPLPAYLGGLGYGSTGIFGLYLVLNASAAAFFAGAAGLTRKRDVALVHAGGLAVRGAAFPSVALLGIALGVGTLGVAGTTLAFVALGLSWAVIAVTAGTLVTRLAPDGLRGEAFGVYGALSALAGGLGGLVGGWLGTASYPVAFAVAGGLVLAGTGVALGVRARTA